MTQVNIESAAQNVANSMASSVLVGEKYDNLPLEDLIEQACTMDETKSYFQQQGIDLEDDTIQLEALCEFQKALTEAIINR
ncbi:hypothetical protein [Pleionea mediterranea]|jgi:hypothetical protein|uniref:Uncharacterized protein n=1 Tax=Pleionea mediterranea TaxID=523701 RepID=A0A316G138_9GAMM|nr:hypothetical protein [Pleionea mediterranea]PWK54518.1 hypothetical protein C8D97_101372 [Pleionea mediterranea]